MVHGLRREERSGDDTNAASSCDAMRGSVDAMNELPSKLKKALRLATSSKVQPIDGVYHVELMQDGQKQTAKYDKYGDLIVESY